MLTEGRGHPEAVWTGGGTTWELHRVTRVHSVERKGLSAQDGVTTEQRGAVIQVIRLLNPDCLGNH